MLSGKCRRDADTPSETAKGAAGNRRRLRQVRRSHPTHQYSRHGKHQTTDGGGQRQVPRMIILPRCRPFSKPQELFRGEEYPGSGTKRIPSAHRGWCWLGFLFLKGTMVGIPEPPMLAAAALPDIGVIAEDGEHRCCQATTPDEQIARMICYAAHPVVTPLPSPVILSPTPPAGEPSLAYLQALNPLSLVPECTVGSVPVRQSIVGPDPNHLLQVFQTLHIALQLR